MADNRSARPKATTALDAVCDAIRDAQLRHAEEPERIIVTRKAISGAIAAVQTQRHIGWRAHPDALPTPTYRPEVVLELHPEDWFAVQREVTGLGKPNGYLWGGGPFSEDSETFLFGIPVRFGGDPAEPPQAP